MGHHYGTLFFCTMLRVIVLLNKMSSFHAVLKTSCVTGIYPVKSVTGGQKAQIFCIKTTKMLYFHIHFTFFIWKCHHYQIQYSRRGKATCRETHKRKYNSNCRNEIPTFQLKKPILLEIHVI